MKTKLATLLIAPALLFTACGAKTISFEEADKFAKEHFHKATEIERKVTAADKCVASWDISKIYSEQSSEIAGKLQDNFKEMIAEAIGEDPYNIKRTESNHENTNIENDTVIILSQEKWTEKFPSPEKAKDVEFKLSGEDLSIKANDNVLPNLIATQEMTLNKEGFAYKLNMNIPACDLEYSPASNGKIKIMVHFEGSFTVTYEGVKLVDTK